MQTTSESDEWAESQIAEMRALRDAGKTVKRSEQDDWARRGRPRQKNEAEAARQSERAKWLATNLVFVSKLHEHHRRMCVTAGWDDGFMAIEALTKASALLSEIEALSDGSAHSVKRLNVAREEHRAVTLHCRIKFGRYGFTELGRWLDGKGPLPAHLAKTVSQ